MQPVGNVPPHIQKLIHSAGEAAKTDQAIAYRVAGKQIQAMEQAGDAAVQMIEQALDLQTQLAAGKLDVRV